jgi:UDP-N-acetylmuramate--alanine ligase
MLDAQKVHIIGIGGIGTSAVAKWYLNQGARVTGSDMSDDRATQELKGRGVEVAIGTQSTGEIPEGTDLVIYSRAVPADNAERLAAKERGITEISFPQFLGMLAQRKKTIAIAGTNGKSTTTAMIAKILIDGGYDPTVILGTYSPDLAEGNFRAGASDWFVVEACEHMASFLHIRPRIAVITNIEEDHLDFYRDLQHIKETFQKWIDNKETNFAMGQEGAVKDIAHGGVVVLNAEDPVSRELEAREAAYYKVNDRKVLEGKQQFDVAGVDIELKIPGQFNASNAAAAITAAHAAGVDDDKAIASLAAFSGTWRRFERVGQWAEKGAEVYSDYAHHPTAIAGTIAAFKEFYGDRRLIIVFEPHQHSRTHELFDEFAAAFDGLSEGDQLILSEVYRVTGRTEEEFEGSAQLTEAVAKRDSFKAEVHFAKDHDASMAQLNKITQSGDIIVIMGAGSIDNLARQLV